MGALASHGAGYASRGWALVPLIPETKRPYVRTGRDHAEAATCDLDVIAEWVSLYPDADVGIVPARAGFVVIDVDDPDAFERYRDEAHPFPLTTMSVSGRDGGGWHLWYRVPPGVAVPRGRVLTPGLELKAAGQLVVAPPSRHRTGRLYAWDVGPDLVAPQFPAPWMLEADRSPSLRVAPRPPESLGGATGTAYGVAALRALLEEVASAVPGTRHAILTAAAARVGELARGGHVDTEDASRRLTLAAAEAFAGEDAAHEIDEAIGWGIGKALA